MSVRSLAVAASFLTLALAGCIGAEESPSGPGFEAKRTDDADVAALSFNFTGKLTGTPASPSLEDFAFEVPKGATEVSAVLTWDGAPVSTLQLTLLDPRGDSAGRGFPERDGRSRVATLDPPASGAWIARVSSARAVETGFSLEVTVSFILPKENVLADVMTVPPADFVELNLIMEGNASFAWRYEADASLKWNIHSHADGRTTIHEEGEGASHESAFTAPKRQIYSVLFESLSPQVVQLSYEVKGTFRVHSHSQ